MAEAALMLKSKCTRVIVVPASQFFREAFQTAPCLADGLIAMTIDGVTKIRVEHWCGQIPKFAKHLCTWGAEAGTVKPEIYPQPKWKTAEGCSAFLLVGYALHHARDCYHMYNPKRE